MRATGILDKKLEALGFSLEEEEDFLYLKHRGKPVATFNATRVTINMVRNIARILSRGYDKRGISG